MSAHIPLRHLYTHLQLNFYTYSIHKSQNASIVVTLASTDTESLMLHVKLIIYSCYTSHLRNYCYTRLGSIGDVTMMMDLSKIVIFSEFPVSYY